MRSCRSSGTEVPDKNARVVSIMKLSGLLSSLRFASLPPPLTCFAPLYVLSTTAPTDSREAAMSDPKESVLVPQKT